MTSGNVNMNKHQKAKAAKWGEGGGRPSHRDDDEMSDDEMPCTGCGTPISIRDINSHGGYCDKCRDEVETEMKALDEDIGLDDWSDLISDGLVKLSKLGSLLNHPSIQDLTCVHLAKRILAEEAPDAFERIIVTLAVDADKIRPSCPELYAMIQTEWTPDLAVKLSGGLTSPTE